MKIKTVLITGINGYLGSKLAKRYTKKYNVIGLEYTLDNLFRLEKETFQVYASKNGIPDELEKAIANGCQLFINTDTVLDRFTSSYALTKKQFGDWLKYYSNKNEIKVINLQLEHFYGPGTANTNFITLMVQKMLSNEPVIELKQSKTEILYI